MENLFSLFNFDRLLAVGSFIFAIVIYRRQTIEQKLFEAFTKGTFKMLKEQGAMNQHHLVKIRSDILFMFYEHAEIKYGYWHFKLRFETWDQLGIHIAVKDRTQYLDIQILGQAIDHINEFKSPFKQGYICEVLEFSGDNLLGIKSGDKVFCYPSGEKKHISKFYHPMVDPESFFEFSIGRLGSFTSGTGGDVPIENLEIHPRVKDSIIK